MLAPPTPLPPCLPQAHGSINQRKEDGSTNQRWKRRKKCCSSRDEGKGGRKKSHTRLFALGYCKPTRSACTCYLSPPPPSSRSVPCSWVRALCLALLRFFGAAQATAMRHCHIFWGFFSALCVCMCVGVCICVWECVAQPQLTFINGILPFFKMFADSWAQKMAARRPLDIIRNTHDHTHMCVVCVCSGVLIYVTHSACTLPLPLQRPNR